MLKPFVLGALLASPFVVLENASRAEPPRPADAVAQASQTHDGKVVSVSDGKLVMTDTEGKNEHTHMITATARITLGGKSAKLTELQKGDIVKVTISAEGVVTMVEASRPVPTL